MAVFCLTHHRGVGAGAGGECRAVFTALGVRFNHLSRSLPLTPHHTAHVNRHRRTMFTRRDAIVAAVGLATDQSEVLGEPTLE